MKKLICAAVWFVCVSAGPSWAQVAREVVRHPSDTNEQFAARLVLQWDRGEGTSPVDGRQYTVVVRQPHTIQQTGWRGNDPSLALEIGCFGGQMTVLFQSRHLVSGHNMRTTLRIGSEVSHGRLRQSESLRAAGFWGAPARAALTRIMAAEEVAVRIEHGTWGTTEAVFDVRGAREATARVREQCRAR